MFKIGDHVALKPAFAGKHGSQTWIVEKFLQVNMNVRPLGGGRGLRGRPEMFDLVPTDGQPIVRDVLMPLPWLFEGQLVTASNVLSTKWRYAADQRFVVINQRGPERVKIAKLGGQGGLTWTVRRDSLTVVEPSL